jgi:NADPH:quinone reductase-like Zn-dependent oxidoreductase
MSVRPSSVSAYSTRGGASAYTCRSTSPEPCSRRRVWASTLAAGRRFAGISVEPDYPGLEALAALVDSGDLRVHLETIVPLAEAAKAHELVETGRTAGKIVLTI